MSSFFYATDLSAPTVLEVVRTGPDTFAVGINGESYGEITLIEGGNITITAEPQSRLRPPPPSL